MGSGRTLQVAVLEGKVGKAERLVREYLCSKNINHEKKNYYTFVTSDGCVICLREFNDKSSHIEAIGSHFYYSYVEEALPIGIKVEIAQRTRAKVFFG